MEKVIDFGNIGNLGLFADTISILDESYLVGRIRGGSDALTALIGHDPLRINGTLVMLMHSGSPVHLSVNQKELVLGPDTALTAFTNHMIMLTETVPDDIDISIMYFDNKFLQNVNINLTAVAMPAVTEKPSPTRQLTPEEMDLLCKYVDLLYLNTVDRTNIQINKQIAASLLAALFFQMVQFHHKRLALEFGKAQGQHLSIRRQDYVRQFLRLVHLNYARERTVKYYSDKMCITAKYLTMLVKEATGRTAAQWIDDFVLTEAKNQLRFSGKNIQQVAYSLNFPTQSSFGKYFRHLTGMSPTEYQKG